MSHGQHSAYSELRKAPCDLPFFRRPRAGLWVVWFRTWGPGCSRPPHGLETRSGVCRSSYLGCVAVAGTAGCPQ